MSGHKKEEYLPLLDAIASARWQRLQDNLTNVLGVPIRTLSTAHDLISTPSWPVGLASEPVIKYLNVGDELEQLLPTGNLPTDTSNIATNLGVTFAAVPIRSDNRQIIAYIVVGPMVVGPRENELEFRDRVSKLGLDAQEMWPVLLSLKLYTFVSLRSVLKLVEEIGISLMQLATTVKQMGSSDAHENNSEKIDDYSKSVLRSLLEAAALATQADGGSIMSYTADGESLVITAAKGLTDSVIEKTRLRTGEGIAGIVAERKSILLIDDQVQEDIIRNQMKRPEITSSLVAPLVSNSDMKPIGVINLRTTSSKKRFTKEHVELLRQLLNLATIALSGIRYQKS